MGRARDGEQCTLCRRRSSQQAATGSCDPPRCVPLSSHVVFPCKYGVMSVVILACIGNAARRRAALPTSCGRCDAAAQHPMMPPPPAAAAPFPATCVFSAPLCSTRGPGRSKAAREQDGCRSERLPGCRPVRLYGMRRCGECARGESAGAVRGRRREQGGMPAATAAAACGRRSFCYTSARQATRATRAACRPTLGVSCWRCCWRQRPLQHLHRRRAPGPLPPLPPRRQLPQDPPQMQPTAAAGRCRRHASCQRAAAWMCRVPQAWCRLGTRFLTSGAASAGAEQS